MLEHFEWNVSKIKSLSLIHGTSLFPPFFETEGFEINEASQLVEQCDEKDDDKSKRFR